MSDNENPIHAPAPVGRPMQGDKPRVSRTLTIAEPSNAFLEQCRKQASSINPKLKAGHIVDRMVAHCQQTKFNPTKENP